MFDDVKRVLIVAAHADDMETIMGGTVAMLTERGVVVKQLLCTRGDIGASNPAPDLTRDNLATMRQAEARAAAAELGVLDVEFLDHPDGELVADLTLRAEIARVYREFQPDTVFTFDPWWPGQAHPDHTATGRAAIDAYMPSKMPLYRPEQLTNGASVAQIKQVYLFGGSATADIVVDVTPYWERKLRATFLHTSQFAQPERATEWLVGWASETGKRIGVQYAEAFAKMNVW